MNFCKECDEYISLYIDELLDEKTAEEFLNHAEQCSQCSAKLKAALYFAGLCREEEEVPLPGDFSEALHNRLEKLNDNRDISKRKHLFFIKNQKIIAGFSAAAVLVISLLAYNLLPDLGIMKKAYNTASTASDAEAAQSVETKKSEDTGNIGNNSNSSEVESGIKQNKDSGSTLMQDKESVQQSSGAAPDSNSTKRAFGEILPPEKKQSNDEEANLKTRKYQEKADAGADTAVNSSEPEDEAGAFSLTAGMAADSGTHISNFAELKVKLSQQGKELEAYRRLIKEIGAVELNNAGSNSAAVNQIEGADRLNNSGSSEEKAQPEYIDCYMTLSQYSRLKNQASKYNLEFGYKTDIIEKDISDIYNNLNNRKIEINNKITEASENGEDTSAYETEEAGLNEAMEKISDRKEIVVVRMYFGLS
ncbi:putative zinc finger protein [Ruminiclostridium sufflavum DSM 19573]|uniref:Putative zinc finger protein n=1 Tax=Ruminiclostridium sufflavum DSM 19573 TaxID=1121337 RepID=A0A318XSW9_9FIRM|nr:zf-HC2 domain-containing protein [Ruminiclostridium sufflavum]PYG89792.1 putative zinc finger protein [Ruminiclostridium sufflavum DSM 19573]